MAMLLCGERWRMRGGGQTNQEERGGQSRPACGNADVLPRGAAGVADYLTRRSREFIKSTFRQRRRRRLQIDLECDVVSRPPRSTASSMSIDAGADQ